MEKNSKNLKLCFYVTLVYKSYVLSLGLID